MPAILTPAAIAAAAAAELPRIFDDALDTLREGEADYLRDGLPTSLPGKISQAAGRSACRIYATGNVDLTPAAAEKYERVCRPYLNDTYPPTGPVIAPPFPGGQCPGIQYSFKYIGTLTDPVFNTGVVETLMVGPLVMDRTVSPPEVCAPGQTYKRWTLRGANNAAVGLWAGCTASLSVVSVTPLSPEPSGGCGSPPPDVRQPDPNPDPTPPPFRFNPGPDIDVDVDVDVDVDGRITVNIGTGPITIDPFGDGGGGGGGVPPSGPGTAGSSDDTGISTVAEGSADEGEELVGVLVEVLEAPTDANRFFNNSAIIFRGACYVTMGYPGRLGLDMSGGTLETSQFFHAQQRGLTNHRVRANLGFNLRVTPYYRSVIL